MPTWPHLGPPNLPKMAPSWLQNRCKLGCRFSHYFLRALGTNFIDFLLQHGMAEVAKIVDSSTFFILFAILVVGLLGWLFYNCLVDFWLIWGSKIHQQSIKHGMEHRMRFWMGCGWLLGPIFDGFWAQLGGQVGAKLAPKSEEMGYQGDVKKSSKI